MQDLFFGLVSDILVTTVTQFHSRIKKIKRSPYLKAFVGGIILIILTKIVGEQYLGLGLSSIKSALDPAMVNSGDVHWYTFLLKTLFSALSLGSGASGGIITPIF